MDNNLFDGFSLEDMAADPREAERFADFVEDRGLLAAPANLKSQILAQSRQANVRLIAGSNHLSKKTELLRYSLKVGLAAACSIALILAAPGFPDGLPPSPASPDAIPIHVEVCQKMQQLTGKIRLFFQIPIDSGGNFHD